MMQDQPPPKPKLSAAEQWRRREDRIAAIRRRITIWRELEERELITPAEIGEVLGMPAAGATKLLSRHRWHEGDLAQLRAAAVRLGLAV